MFTEILVSTDNDEIAETARLFGATVPFKRPAGLATDYATTAAVVNHAIEWLRTAGHRDVQEFLVAYPTSVMMTVPHVHDSHLHFRDTQSPFVFSAARFPSEIRRAWHIEKEGVATPIFPELQESRSQDHEPAFFDAGQLYWATQEGWTQQEQGTFVGRRIFELPIQDAIDINTEADWLRAEKAFAVREGLRLPQGSSSGKALGDPQPF
jgi:N-acylneuraminate cytidylyltransferase